MNTEIIQVAGRQVQKGRYTMKKPLVFTTGKEVTSFYGYSIPSDTEVKFWETRNFGWLVYRDVNNNLHICKV